MKRQKLKTLKGEPPRLVGFQMLLRKGRKAAKGMKRLSQSENNTPLWMYLVVKVKSDAIRNSNT